MLNTLSLPFSTVKMKRTSSYSFKLWIVLLSVRMKKWKHVGNQDFYHDCPEPEPDPAEIGTMESWGNILLGLRSGGDLFVEGGIGTKIPSEYFAETGIETGFCRVRDNRDRVDKSRSHWTLILSIYTHFLNVASSIYFSWNHTKCQRKWITLLANVYAGKLLFLL